MEKLFGSMFDGGEGNQSDDDTENDRQLTILQQIRLEFNQYITEKASMNDDPLQWWLKNGAIRYPLIARLARACLAIPATSVPSERLFSAAGNLLTAKRSCLASCNVDKLLFLNKNLSKLDGM